MTTTAAPDHRTQSRTDVMPRARTNVRSARNPIPARQRAALIAVRDHLAEHGYPPTIVEVGQAIGISGRGATKLIDRAARRGYIRRTTGVPRSLVLLVSDAELDAADDGPAAA